MKKIISVLSVAVIISCSSGDDKENVINNNFNKSALLTNWADNIIIPSYEDYQMKVQSFQSDVANFTASPTATNLQSVRASWMEAYTAYQNVSLFYFGKAMEINLKEKTNTYPTNVVGIDANIASGNYNLDLLSQYGKQGFPALDYLINGLATTDGEILILYSTHSNSAGYRQYLTDVAAKIKTNVDIIVADWKSDYRNSYIANNGNTISSAVNVTANVFVKNFEKDVRAAKLGIPAGVFSSGTTFPEKVEAFYKKDISKVLLNAAIKSQQDFFNGKHFNSTITGEGLKSYLDYVNAVRNGQNLSAIINNQFDTIFATNNNLNNNISGQIVNDNTKILASYDALQRNVIYMKLDMMQALNITIDYVDGDGD